MMLAAQKANRGRSQSSLTRSIPAPVGGLNARDALADMDEKDAVILDNFFPGEGFVSLRGGHAPYKTGMDGAIESIIVYNSPTGSEMFACNDGKIYDATSTGAVGAAEVSSLTNDRWSYVNFSTSGGNFVICVNGADAPQNYNGSAWATTPAITGVTPANLNYVASHKERLWFVEKDTTSAWYLATQAIGGTATKYPLGSVFREGGKLVAISSLSADSGSGPDDFAAFLSSEGEILVYQGTDPANASTWALVGRYKLGKPIGSRPFVNLGGDLLCLTRDGVVSVSKMMQKSPAQSQYASVTNKIAKLINSDSKNYSGNFGWELNLYPRGQWLLVNVPKNQGTEQIQYVMNVNTGSWCRFLGMNANCWAVFDDRVYFGGNDGTLYRADTGYNDNGSNITGEIKGAFQYFGARGRKKLYTLIRAVITSTGQPSIYVGMDVDFSDQSPSGTVTPPVSTQMTWGSMFWGSMFWGGAENILNVWKSIFGLGICAAPRLRAVCNGQTCSVNSFDVVMQPGGPV